MVFGVCVRVRVLYVGFTAPSRAPHLRGDLALLRVARHGLTAGLQLLQL